MDDDVRVRPGWAAAMAGALADDGVAFVTGRILLPPGMAWTDVPIATKEEPDAARLDDATTGVLGHSANAAVRRIALDAVSGFDERLGAGAELRAAEDNDLFDRLLAAGFVGRYEPEAEAWHEQWRRRRQLLGLNYGYGYGSGARLAKLLRTDRRRARRVGRAVFWDWGLADARRWLPRHRYAAALAVTRVVAATLGLARALALPVRNGHFRPGPAPAAPSGGPIDLSVVIPCRNDAGRLAEALAALAADPFKGTWEVVVADNGSRDGTAAVALSFADTVPVRVVDASGRRGPWFARNVGAAASRGRSLVFLDSDDVAAPGYLAHMADALAGADLAAAAQDGQRLNPGWLARSRPLGLEGGLNHSLGFLPFATSCCLGIRREVFEDLGGFSPLRTCEDVDLCWRAQLAGRTLVPAAGAVLHYRFRHSSRDSFRQAVGYGSGQPFLYRRYRAAGMPRRRVRSSVADTIFAVRRMVGAGTEAHRLEGAYLTGLAVGRALGSLRHRVLYV